MQKPTLAVWKFASCDGCQLSILALEDDLLELARSVEIAHFLEVSSHSVEGPYDLSLIEGSITTPDDARRIREIRSRSKILVTIGACATAGGIQALRNFSDVDSFIRQVYARPEYIDTLATSTPISAHVRVDYELQGCPVNKFQLLEVVTALLHDRRPSIASESVCMECKRRGLICVLITGETFCLGPVTQSGCGALCPAYRRGCYGCFGPKENPNMRSMSGCLQKTYLEDEDLVRVFRTFYAAAPDFAGESRAVDARSSQLPTNTASPRRTRHE